VILSMLMAPQEAAPPPGGAEAPAAAVAETVKKLPPLETEHSWAMPTDASTFAEGTDALYLFIVALDVFFFILVIGVMAYFMWKYRRRSKDQKTSSITHSGKIEFLWSAIPAVLLVVIFVWGEIDFLKQTVPPQDAIDIRITGRTWQWTAEYPDYPGARLLSGSDQPALLVPKDRPVRLTMTSEDVLHSFYIPAFRVKRDAVPGRYTNMWFEATRVGEFNVFCAEYCGDQHSTMTGFVKVVEPEHFEELLKELSKLERDDGESLADFGRRVYTRRGCESCHSLDGSAKTGPSWQGLWGSTREFQDGRTVKVEGADGENYIRTSILEPGADVVAGFAPNMPSFQGQLDEEQITALIEFIKTVR
jgi:cytochrome c oxidase subunit II